MSSDETNGDPPAPGLPRGHVGRRLGHYRVTHSIGHGGMGEVFAAHDETLHREVALKALHGRYLEDETARLRLLREARLLSRLEHPNICQIYEFLSTEHGDFLVLELIRGRTLRGAERLPLRRVLDIGSQILDALASAHRQGVVHRDLKPGNVMVTEDDRIKVLDFGLARSLPEEQATLAWTELEQRGTPQEVESLRTNLDASLGPGTLSADLLGTPAFMSPEQARGEEATPASDMFSFGLMLRGLLGGGQTGRSGGDLVGLLERATRGEVPPVTGIPKPLLALLDDLAHLDPTRRPSADQARTRLREIREAPRRRLVRLLAALFVVSLISGTVATGLAVLQAREESRRANQEARNAEEVASFLVELFEDTGPGRASDGEVTVHEVLDEGARRVRGGLADQPDVQARLMNAIGRVYLSLGDPENAAPLVEDALALRRDRLGERDPATAESLESVVRLRSAQGRADEQEEAARRALEIRESTLEPEDPAIAESLRSLAWALVRRDRYEEARPLLERALAIRTAALPPDDPDLAQSLFDLGHLHWRLGNLADAERLLHRWLEAAEEALGPDHHRLVNGLEALGGLLWSQGRPGEAEEMFRRALAILEKTTGGENVRVATTLGNLGLLAAENGRPEEAVERLNRAVALQERTVGRRSPPTAAALANLAWAHHRAGHLEEARPLFREAAEIQEATLGPDHSQLGTTLTDFAALLADLGRPQEAVSRARRALDIRREALGPEHLRVAETLVVLARAQRRAGRLREALQAGERALEIRSAQLPDGHPAVAELEALREELRKERSPEPPPEARR